MLEVMFFSFFFIGTFCLGLHMRWLHDTVDSYKKQLAYYQQAVKRMEKRIKQLEMRGNRG